MFTHKESAEQLAELFHHQPRAAASDSGCQTNQSEQSSNVSQQKKNTIKPAALCAFLKVAPAIALAISLIPQHAGGQTGTGHDTIGAASSNTGQLAGSASANSNADV